MNSIEKAIYLHVLLIGGVFAAAPQAYADAVTDWNEIAVSAATTGRPGPPGIVDIALVQVAVRRCSAGDRGQIRAVLCGSRECPRQAIGGRGGRGTRRTRGNLSSAGWRA